MAAYQVIARKYRPQRFEDVLGQGILVQTLQAALQKQRLGHAYLFCGPKGTGKTTLTRIFAKALNCTSKDDPKEPCNLCPSCLAITSGSSLDVIEIDGASSRSIEDVRKLCETAHYAPSGQFRIFIVDEVHMLTKEAFNALLKTLEEPPKHTKFFFATTEPHKLPATILSRCQIFNLKQIEQTTIVDKLKKIVEDAKVQAEEDALYTIASHADGSLRDAESLLDQMIAFCDEKMTSKIVNESLGLVEKDLFFALDIAGKEGDISFAFNLAHTIFSQGKDPYHFLLNLIEHIRALLCTKLTNTPSLCLPKALEEKYKEHAKMYRRGQLSDILEYLIEKTSSLRGAPSAKIALESIILHILRSHFQIPADYLVQRLIELEKSMQTKQKPIETALQDKKDPQNQTKEDLGAHCETLLQFAAVELEGQLQKK